MSLSLPVLLALASPVRFCCKLVLLLLGFLATLQCQLVQAVRVVVLFLSPLDAPWAQTLRVVRLWSLQANPWLLEADLLSSLPAHRVDLPLVALLSLLLAARQHPQAEVHYWLRQMLVLDREIWR
jgi:hypothetical protein